MLKLVDVKRMDLKRRWYEFKRDFRLMFGLIDRQILSQQQKIICFSHHKCATKWTGQILEALCDELEWNCFWGYRPITDTELSNLEKKYHVIFFHRSEPGDFPGKFDGKNFKGFHVIRDPRDILVSQYFSHMQSHELNRYTQDIEADRAYLNTHSKEEGLLYMMEYSRHFIKTMACFERWPFDDGRLLELKFEDLVKDPFQQWQRILTFIEMPVGNQVLEKILARYSFKALQSRQKDKSLSHYRSGRHRDFEDHFTPRIKAAFKEKFGLLLVRLNYETSHHW
ncbi:MAG: hypothetical protein COV74_09850 [Candidatus Omnitrophica bacterium CG11_big_fil_rev_8_21_14_0_20_45_26]|uniref:Sulfotransferase domain-containing protein n=1 Tax=Candidatus Abzuiibacterium crystallinum TaxID=1974748 RepID=A0A2H0LLG0_9BACT|nr:MAG: hypothetical protein COV74_09850 [Candidatus Omnitrophica bacterium CG11_big_fil_rev_8_21_14_0_20_45_26]PIW64509.1 MAG: hypothetical protein COW12_05975 [Candidatus Omnitrophica bacterium CG12_big_fil_rev_8_21_14_0_65_45_16]